MSPGEFPAWSAVFLLLRPVVVTVASIQDRDGARLLLNHLPGHRKKLRMIWADGGGGETSQTCPVYVM